MVLNLRGVGALIVWNILTQSFVSLCDDKLRTCVLLLDNDVTFLSVCVLNLQSADPRSFSEP